MNGVIPCKMSEFKNFKITLHLTHFFQDHRSLCKIFISEKMKNIKDLQNHIQNIFQIKDFFLMSNGHYVPPSEDIRILQSDDVIIAIPTKSNSTAICTTSTPMVSIANHSVLKEKSKRQYLEDGQSFPNCDSGDYSDIHVKKKKKKKRNTDSNQICNSEQGRLYPNIKGDVQEHNMELDVNNKRQTDVKSSIIENKKSGKIHTKQNTSFDLMNLSMSDINQSSPKSSVKAKVLRLEKQALNNESIDRKQNVYKVNNIIDNEIKNQEHEMKKIELTLDQKKKEENNTDYIKNKKLFIRKRKSDLICFDLAKKSNIVTNILVSNTTSTVNSDQKDFDHLFQEKHHLLGDVTKSVQNNKSTFQNPEKPRSQINSNFHNEHKQIKINNNIVIEGVSVSEEAEFRDLTNNSDGLVKTINTNTIDNLENSNLREEYSINEEIKQKDTTSVKEVNKPEENLEDKSIPFVEKGIDNDLDLMHTTQPKQSSQIENLDISLLAKDSSLQNANISSERNTLIDNDLSCSTVGDKYDTVSFITKRKRKRAHRKRKSKASVNNSPILLVAQTDYDESVSHFTVTPAVHTKFNDNGEPINYIEKQEKTEEWSEKVSTEFNGDLVGTTVEASESDKILGLKTSLNENKSSINNDICHITINDTIEMNDKASISGGMLSEDIILKSPIMTSTKPKPGDLIAFKMLRLTENYTPEISNYIIGEILSFNEITTNVGLKILDGLDQCAQPSGKFSIEDSDKELSSMKSYCWTSLREPRLIFP